MQIRFHLALIAIIFRPSLSLPLLKGRLPFLPLHQSRVYIGSHMPSMVIVALVSFRFHHYLTIRGDPVFSSHCTVRLSNVSHTHTLHVWLSTGERAQKTVIEDGMSDVLRWCLHTAPQCTFAPLAPASWLKHWLTWTTLCSFTRSR